MHAFFLLVIIEYVFSFSEPVGESVQSWVDLTVPLSSIQPLEPERFLVSHKATVSYFLSKQFRKSEKIFMLMRKYAVATIIFQHNHSA